MGYWGNGAMEGDCPMDVEDEFISLGREKGLEYLESLAKKPSTAMSDYSDIAEVRAAMHLIKRYFPENKELIDYSISRLEKVLETLLSDGAAFGLQDEDDFNLIEGIQKDLKYLKKGIDSNKGLIQTISEGLAKQDIEQV